MYGAVHRIFVARFHGRVAMPIKVLVVDDSRFMRDAIMRLFNDNPDIQVVAQAESFTQTIELAGELHPEVIVMDLHMPDERSVQPTALKASLNGAKVVTEWLPAIRQCAAAKSRFAKA